MSRRPEGLSLDDDDLMVRKGEARGVAPAAAVRPPAFPDQPPAIPTQMPSIPPTQEPPTRTKSDASPEDPPIVIGKRQTIERVFTNVRIPVDLDERLYRMMVETRRKKQDLIEAFIRAGLDRYEADRRRSGARSG